MSSAPVLYGPDNRPISSGGAKAYGSYPVSRVAGGLRGTLSNWLVSRNNRYSERLERETISDRAEDITGNDPHAASVVDSIAINSVGTGLVPQSRPNTKYLKWSEEQARDFQAQAEWAFHIWQQEADAAGRLNFWQICLLSVYSMLVRGEFFRIPVMENRPEKTFSLALQCVDPMRMYTPFDNNTGSIRDGIEFGNIGRPEAYWIANPEDGFISRNLPQNSFSRIPARAGHRPGAFHVFLAKTEEQIRGMSILAPALKAFKDLNDYLDFELVGAIVAASFPVFIESNDPTGMAAGFPASDSKEEKVKYQETAPGQILYGNHGEKPHVLRTDRPGNTFAPFVERILRGIGASCGMPYEVVAKDFSKTNYSSARAALLEAGRVYSIYQQWLIDGFCQPVWKMVLEEAWLRGMITLPEGSPDWYDAVHAYTRASWIPPRKGHVDPSKEIDAFVKAKDHNLSTIADIAAELGRGDWEDLLEQRAREREKERKNDISPPSYDEDGANEPEEEDEEFV